MRYRLLTPIAALIGPERTAKALERSGRFEGAWSVLARHQMRKIESEPSILWTVEFGEDSLQLSRLALWAGGPERAWYAAKHALAAFAWKGLDDNEDVVVQADAIAQKAESSIPDLRLEDLKAEFADHLTLWDPSRRLDKNVALLDEYDKRKLGKMIRRTIASVDLHGRWP